MASGYRVRLRVRYDSIYAIITLFGDEQQKSGDLDCLWSLYKMPFSGP